MAVAPSIRALFVEANRRWPARSKASDGTIGDAKHASRKSDHNPGARGLVHAGDLTHDPRNGVDCNVLAERVKARVNAGVEKRVSYIIWNRQIFNPSKSPNWRAYTGSNPHDKHMHISVLSTVAAEQNTADWFTTSAPPAPARVYPIYDYEEDSVRATIVDVKVGPDGKGWNAWDTGKVAPIPSGCVLSGLRPKPVAQGGDGKYPGYAGITPSVAVEKQWLLVAVEGAPPGTVIPVYVSVA